MTQQAGFVTNPAAAAAQGRAAWNESFAPVLSELRDVLGRRTPARIAALTGVDWDENAGAFHLNWLQTPYRITWPELVAYPAQSAAPCPANTQGLFLYYLATADGTPAAQRWIAFRELPDGWLYQQAFQGYTGHVLAQSVGDDVAALAAACAALDGAALDLGDCGYAFQVLPGVALALVYWRGDDEFEPEARVLFDAAAPHYLSTDGLAILGSHLVRQVLTHMQTSAPRAGAHAQRSS
jgi:hypothetical protein